MTESAPLDGGTSHTWLQMLRGRLQAMALRPTARPLGWGIVVAVCIIASIVGALVSLRLEGADRLAPALLVFLPLMLLAGALVGQARRRAADAERRRREAQAPANRQAALYRVATLVASRTDPVDLYPVAATEVAHGIGVDYVTLVRFEPDGRCTVLAAHGLPGRATLQVGERLALDGHDITTRIQHILGLRSALGVPVTVDDLPRGALIVGSSRTGQMSPETEEHIGEFADLVATAIANAETSAELVASRARTVAAADLARRRFERDLHDGAQQRVAALGLGLRTIEASIPTEDHVVRQQLDNVINGMADLYTNLGELSRGIHPAAILSKGGLGPALRNLARRSAVPASVDVDVDRRLPESTEVTAYYVVAEALTNAAKHARASGVAIRVGLGPDELHIEVADNGVGGATPISVAGAGSGLVGLRDRVETLAGRLDVSSPPGGGTTLTATIPRAQDAVKEPRGA